MATLIPASQPSNVEAAYEDMFKEITRKLYGEETGNGLHTLGTPVAQVATTGPTAPEGERSFTTLMSDRNLTTIDYDQQQQHQHQQQQPQASQHNNGLIETTATINPSNFKTEDHLTTAFGLAALMHNGFHSASNLIPKVANTTGANSANSTISSTVSINNGNNNNSNSTTVTGTNNDQHQSQQQQQNWNTNPNDDLLQQWQTETKPVNFHTPIITPKLSKLNKNKNSSSDIQFQPATSSQGNNQMISLPKKNKNNLQNTVSNQQLQQPLIQKRYSCTHCPYSTDRRDLYTRHENIHKDEKPFQCYACLKQFNRADHVKKHFLRMHRELTYDISKTRRNINNSNNNSTSNNNNGTINASINTSSPSSIDQKPINLFNTEIRNITNNNQLTEHFLNTQRVLHQASSSSIAQTIESVATATESTIQIQVKQEKITNDEKLINKVKPQREKRFTCCYCPWSGADKWGLKRHLNTHTKPFVCMLCDYKAARSERLATHVLKVHNKKACNKCSFLADTQEEFQTHLNEVHPHDNRPSRHSNNNSNVLRTISSNNNNNQINNFNSTNNTFGNVQNNGIYNNNNNSNSEINTNNIQSLIANPTTMTGWRIGPNGSLIPPSHLTEPNGLNGNPSQKRGAERLFSYLEADGSDPEDYARQLKMEAISRNTSSVAQDFHKAGGVVNRNSNINNKNNACHKSANISTKNISMDNDVIKKKFQESSTIYLQQNQVNLNNLNGHQHTNINNNNINKIISPSEYNIKIDNQLNIDSTIIAKQFNELSCGQKKAMLDQIKKSPPAFLLNNHTNFANNKDQDSAFINFSKINNSNTIYNNTNPIRSQAHHLELNQNNKENTNSIFAKMEYENLSKLNVQFQNYVRNIINKYYAETPLLYPSPLTDCKNEKDEAKVQKERFSCSSPSTTTYPVFAESSTNLSTLSQAVDDLRNSPCQIFKNSLDENVQLAQSKINKTETEDYIEYLRNKEDITLIVQPKKQRLSAKIMYKEPEKPSIEILLAPKKVTELHSSSSFSKPAANYASSKENKNDLEFNQICIERNNSVPVIKNKILKLQDICQNIAELPKTQIISNNTKNVPYKNISIEFPIKILQHNSISCDASRKRKQTQPKRLLYPEHNEILKLKHTSISSENENPLELVVKSTQKSNNIDQRQWKIEKNHGLKQQIVNKISKLRDRHMRKLIDEKRICILCSGNQSLKSKYDQDLVSLDVTFPYHTKRSLRLHRLWKHSNWMLGKPNIKCSKCKKTFLRKYSLRVHYILTH